MASSSSATPASIGASSSSDNYSRYDVFLSFRGQDTRNSFTDHLYEALKNAGIHTFRDNDEIRRGEKLKPEIERAIEASLASVIVLSKNYATSTWCLEELRLILKQRRECNQFVLPVFYDADPSDVKKQNNTFMIQVKTSSMWTDYNVRRWKAALTEVANLTGLVLSGSETKFIKKIVDTVYKSVCRQQFSLPHNLIGLDSLDIEISSWLNDSDVEFLVICGMGGSGKTTLALYIVSLIWNSFESVSIMENIGIWKEPHDLLQPLEKLFKDISGGKKRIIPSVSQGKFAIEKALQEKKALIVLDDIVETRQLVALLGPGIINKQSKIIITTRKSNIGKWFGSTSWRCREYQMKLLNNDKSLELLSLHAFKSRIPMEGYLELANQAVQYCEGNPLALEVLGSSLFDSAGDFSEANNIPVWESTLKLLKRDIHKGIQDVLIRSYDLLPNTFTKHLFLHIACFFTGKDVDYVTKILEQDYFALSGIKTLTNRCLLSISSNKKLIMHRLLQEMGRHIVDQESSTLTKRSRIWRYKDACHVLKNRKGSEKVEGLALDMSKPIEVTYAYKSGLKTDSLREMNNLKLLQLNFVELTGSYENLSEDLRWLCWHGFRLRTLPSELFIGNLVALDMSYSCLEIFEPPMILQSLKILNLKGSQYLLEIRFISRLPNLETLVLCGCVSLVHVCETLGDLTSLDLLNMTGCENLCKWNKMNTLVGPSESVSFGGVKEHTTLSLPRSLQRFYLNKCNLECTDFFPLSFSMQPFLKYLNLDSSLFEVLPPYDHFPNLRVLDLSFCAKLKWLLCLPNTLAELYIYYCMSIEKITFQSPRFTLQEFGYRGCTNLCEIEGFIKLIPIAKLDETAMGHMKWLKEYQHLEVCLVGDDELTEDRSLLVQILFEFDLMSISLPDIEDPNMSPDFKSESPSLSFDVPSCPKERIHGRLKGLNLHFKYTISGDDWGWFAKITSTNGVDILYNPKIFGRPGFGEVGIWFSYWPIGNMLDVGDKVNVSIAVMYGLVIHECGASLVYSDDEVADESMKNNMGWEETIGRDLSGFQLSTKTYYLCRRDFYELMEVGRLTPGWLSILVGDNIDDTEVRGWRKTGRPKQLNPSFTELKTVRCIIYGPGLEEVFKIAETLKPSGFSHVSTKPALDMPEKINMSETTKSTLASLEKKKEPATKDLLETTTAENDVSHAIGIDLGSIYSCVGVWKNDRVEIIPNIQCYRTTPSCVALSGAARLIGVKAMNRFTVNPTSTVYDVKRLIGRRLSDAKVQEDMKLWPFQVITGPNDIPKVVVSYKGEEKEFFAEEISSMVLMKLKEDAESYLGKTVKDAVITVPTYFDDSQRQATMDACDVAGFNVLQMINDSTAAAITYGLDKRTDITRDTTVLIFDLGGGTFDVSLVTIDEKGKLEVKAVAGDTHLGGLDFDNVLLDHFVMEFNKKTKTDISGNRKALATLRVSCEKAKRILSSTTQTSIDLDCLHEGIDFSTTITRTKFENLNAEIFSKCMQIMESCLTDARTNKKDVDEVILVGGSTRIPKVQQLLQDFFDGKELCKTIDVDEAVAYGAAVLAAKLSGKTSKKMKDLFLLDIVPLSLGTNLPDGTLDVIIPRYTPIPAKNERTYYTTEDNQSNITVDIYQGETITAKDNNWLGKLTIEVPPAPKAISQVNVVFNIDANGILNCSGEEVTGGLSKKIIVTVNKQRLSMEEIKKMKKDAEKYKFDDDEYKKLIAVSDLKDYISDVRFLVKSYNKTMNKNDMEKIEIALQDAKEYVDGRKDADVYTVKKILNQLKKICDPIMQTGPEQSFGSPKATSPQKFRS